MSAEERIAVLETAVTNGFEHVSSKLDEIETKFDARAEDVNERVNSLELSRAAQNGFIKALVMFAAAPAIAVSAITVIAALRAF